MSQHTTSNEPTDWRDQTTWPVHKTLVAVVAEAIFKQLLPLKFDVTITGAEHLPDGAFIFSPNHISHFDPMFAGLAVYPRHAFFMAKMELFKNPLLRWYFRQYGTFPVHRRQRDMWALEHAGRVLEAGQVLCMFPEGTRSRNEGKLGKGKMGTVKLAVEFNVPVIPAAFIGSQHAKLDFSRTEVAINIGEPIDFNALAGSSPPTLRKLRDLTVLLMQHIAALLPPEMRGVYG